MLGPNHHANAHHSSTLVSVNTWTPVTRSSSRVTVAEANGKTFIDADVLAAAEVTD